MPANCYVVYWGNEEIQRHQIDVYRTYESAKKRVIQYLVEYSRDPESIKYLESSKDSLDEILVHLKSSEDIIYQVNESDVKIIYNATEEITLEKKSLQE